MTDVKYLLFSFIIGSLFVPVVVFLVYFVGAFITWDWVILTYFTEHLFIYIRFGMVFGLFFTLFNASARSLVK